MRCQACQAAFVDRPPSVEELHICYQDPAYFAGDEGQGYRDYADMHKALAPHFHRRLRTLQDALGRCGQLLDFGCADGYFLELARTDGWQIAGVELAQEMAERAARTLRAPIAISLDALPAGDFDAITMWEVIEHLPRPVAELSRLRGRLRPGGMLVLSTPNAGHWQAVCEPENWTAYRPPSHLVLFTVQALTAALQQAGFERIIVQRTAPLPPLPRWLRRVCAPLQHGLSTGQARPWPVALALWRAIRLVGWAWHRLAHHRDDIFVTLEAQATCPL
jgi:SAM-dependent methyltransferase